MEKPAVRTKNNEVGLSFYQALLAYKANRSNYRAFQAHVDTDLMPGLLALFRDNLYQPNLRLCETLGHFIASLVATELRWQQGSIDRLKDMCEEDLVQELYVLIYGIVDAWNTMIEFELYFVPVLVAALVEWYKKQ